ncbi:hypothetical protein KIN20_016190 [Parelaphostrongylus tenuis]|uniref:Uncharacterized protein n=1 Tax=Parelaphostrongylus tenuis TaxID=148309 RepID=A0AAD5N141_PARTN|nr:hypothetical protein KIN20_016190 [Parelaphostrongylus tenuis]
MPSCERSPPRTPKSTSSPLAHRSNNSCFKKGTDSSVIYQPMGHPRQSIIDGEIWPPIFKPEHLR